MKQFILLFFSLQAIIIPAQVQSKTHNYYKAKLFSQMNESNSNNSNPHYYFYKAVYANVCNQPAISKKYLDSLDLKKIDKNYLFNYWILKNDNEVKLFDYKNAFASNKILNTQFKKELGKDLDGSKQTELIWKTLSGNAPQRIVYTGKITVPLHYDLAGLMNIKVKANTLDTNFVFDTGAGISSITETFAKLLGVRTLAGDEIEVEGFSGIANKIRIGILDSIEIGGIKIHNPYFLIFNDKALTFANGAYKINGIIGLPIAKDLGTITIEKKQLSFERQEIREEKNFFIELLHPIIILKLDGVMAPYNFDTGAAKTLFSKTFYEVNKANPQLENAKKGNAEAGSAGGSRKYNMLEVSELNMNLSDQKIIFNKAEIDLDNYHSDGKELYGNIGQDLLKKYTKVIMSFDNNYLKLEK